MAHAEWLWHNGVNGEPLGKSPSLFHMVSSLTPYDLPSPKMWIPNVPLRSNSQCMVQPDEYDRRYRQGSCKLCRMSLWAEWCHLLPNSFGPCLYFASIGVSSFFLTKMSKMERNSPGGGCVDRMSSTLRSASCCPSLRQRRRRSWSFAHCWTSRIVPSLNPATRYCSPPNDSVSSWVVDQSVLYRIATRLKNREKWGNLRNVWEKSQEKGS